MIKKEVWPFYRTISSVRLCWELEEPKGPEGPKGTSVIRNSAPPRTLQKENAEGPLAALRGRAIFYERGTPVHTALGSETLS